MTALWKAPTANFFQTTLSGAITSGQSTITLNSTTGLQYPGYVVIDRVDSNGNSTSALREVVSFTGISGQNLTGCTRGADNGTGLNHNSAAVVESNPTVGMWNDVQTIFGTAFDGNGLLNAVASPVSIAYPQIIQTAITSIASIAQISTVTLTATNISTTTLTATSGIGFTPVFVGAGLYSGPTIGIGGLLKAPRAGTLKWVSIVTQYVVSGASVAFDFKLKGTSIFANATTCPAIAAGGTYVSTASIGTTAVAAGDEMRADILSVGTAGNITQFSIEAGAI